MFNYEGKNQPKKCYNQGANFQVIANIFLLNRNCFLRIKEIRTLPDLEREGWLSKGVLPGQVLVEEVVDDWHVEPEGEGIVIEVVDALLNQQPTG